MLPFRFTLGVLLLTGTVALSQESILRRIQPAVSQQGDLQRDAEWEKRVADRRAKIAKSLSAEVGKKLDALAGKLLDQVSSGPLVGDPERIARLHLASQFPGLTAEQQDLACFYVLAEVARLVPLQIKPPDEVDAVSAVSEQTNMRYQMLLDRRSRFVAALSKLLTKTEKTPDGLLQTIK